MRAASSKPRQGRNGSVAEVVIASCTGLARLSGDIGLPPVHVDAALDADAAGRSLHTTQHGCAVPWPGSFQPLLIEPGWADWALFPLEPQENAGADATSNLCIADGRLRVLLPDYVPLDEFRGQLAATLRYLRLQEVTMRTDFLERRSDELADLVVHPRYTPPRAADHDHRDAVLLQDLYVLDPIEVSARLLWLVTAARAATIEGPSAWR